MDREHAVEAREHEGPAALAGRRDQHDPPTTVVQQLVRPDEAAERGRVDEGALADRNLEGAFGWRAITQRAKGILKERRSVDERAAFELLRAQSRRTGRKFVDVAEAVVEGHGLLPAHPRERVPDQEVT